MKLCLAVVALLFARPAFCVEDMAVSVYWDCPQTVSLTPRPLPPAKALSLPYHYEGDEIVVDTSAWQAFLQPALTGGTDYHSCILNATSISAFVLTEDCEKKFGKDSPKCSTAVIAKALLPVEKVSQGAIEELAGKSLLPPVLPMEDPAKGNIKPGAPAAIRMKNGCAPGNFGTGADEIQTNMETWSPKFIAKELPKVMSEVDSECRSSIVKGYLARLSDIRLPPGCAPNGPAAKDPTCARILEKTGALVQELSKYSIKPGSKQDEFLKSLPNCFVTSPNFGEFLSKLNESFGIAKSCAAKEPGVDHPIPGGYGQLRRLPDENGKEVFEAAFNLKYVPEEADVDPAKFMADTEQCYKDAEPYLKTRSGARLRLVMEVKANPAVIKIKKDPDGRSHSRSYEPTADCAARVHESLHLLGLTDLYFEPAAGYTTSDTGASTLTGGAQSAPKPKYPCRSLGPQESIMNEHWHFGSAVKEKQEPKPWLYDSELNVIAYGDCLPLSGSYKTCSKYQYEPDPPANCGLPAECRDSSWITGAKTGGAQ